MLNNRGTGTKLGFVTGTGTGTNRVPVTNESNQQFNSFFSYRAFTTMLNKIKKYFEKDAN
jgi:hypothetical protein